MITENNMLNYLDRVTPQWIAGFFDGEGCVTSSFDSYGNVKLRVTIAQSNINILYLIMIKCPGSIRSYKQTNKTGSITNHNTIRWDGKDCLKILEMIKDYTVVKNALVSNGIELAKHFQFRGGNGHEISPQAQQERIELKDKISFINQSNKAKSA